MSDFVSNGGQIAHERGSVNTIMHHHVVTLEEIGGRLRAARESRGLNQEDFAALGGVTRNSQAAYEAGRRACDAGYLTRLQAGDVDVCYVLTGERSAGTMPADVAEYADLAPKIGSESRAALLAIAGALAGRGGAASKPVTPQPIALPPVEALERGYLGILMASRSMDEAALARELATRLPMLLDVLKGPLTMGQEGDEAAEAPASADPVKRRA